MDDSKLDKVINELNNLPTIVHCGFYQLRMTHSLRDEVVELLKKQQRKSDKILSPDDFKNEMQKSAKEHDWEDRHLEADNLMGKLLDGLGYKEGMEVFWNMERWYA